MDRRRAAGALLALAACIACSAAAPTASDHTALDLYEGAKEGCYYNFQHYGEGDRIMTNEPCLNCTCHNRMLMCYLRVCPFTKPIGQDCTVEKRADQCCPIVTCPDVPVDLLTSTSTSSPAEYGATGLGKLDKYGCSINGKYFPEGSKVPPTPNKPCEHCYCIRNMTTCVMQECTLHVDGCTPIYHKDVCCPVRYSCDHPEDEIPLLDDMSTTVRPTPGFLLTTTTLSPVTQMSQDCMHNDQIIPDGASISTEKACEHCYCMKGDIVCVVQECGAPMENEGKNCTSLLPREGQCCPDTYICEGDEPITETPTEYITNSLLEKLSTLSPPRRTGIEGSGYRNEPDKLANTEMPTVESQPEGSGEEQETIHTTFEPFSPEKTIEPEEIMPVFEERDQYIPVTTKAPILEESDTSTKAVDGIISGDNIDIETDEPPKYIPTTQQPTKQDVNKITQTIDDSSIKPYETGTIIDTSALDSLAKITTEPGEYLNTVPDIMSEIEYQAPHKYDSITTNAPSLDERVTTLPKGSEKPNDTSLNKDEVLTLRPLLQETTEFEYVKLTSEISDNIDRATTEKPNAISDSEIEKMPEVFIGTSTIVPEIEEKETITPQIIVDSKPDQYGTSTTIIPIKDIGQFATEADHAQNTIDVVEDAIGSSEEMKKVTVSDLDNVRIEVVTKADIPENHEDVSSSHPNLGEGDQTTIEPYEELHTILNEISEGGQSSPADRTTSAVETKPTEPTIIVDTTKDQEKDIELSPGSTSLKPLLETHITRGDQYTITTEPSFRREDESSVSTEKPKEESERTTVKSEFVDEGLIPTSTHEEDKDTVSNVPSMDEDITTLLPDYNGESEEKVSPIQSMTEAVPAAVSIGVTENIISDKQGEILPSTEKSADASTEDDRHEESSRIPGEGDCLVNFVTYKNNTAVPTSNKCHISCKCVSSIIKCDPIICSLPPDYMNNCQSIYDSPDSCCPTYICENPKETVPPKSDSQMSGTESPIPPQTIECRGDQCELSEPTKKPLELDHEFKSTPGDCGALGCDILKEPVSSLPSTATPGCTDGQCKPSVDSCTHGECQSLPTHNEIPIIKPCEGENCKTTSDETLVPQPCVNGEECKKTEVTVPQIIPCEGETCRNADCEGSGCDFNALSQPQDSQQQPCREESGCSPQEVVSPDCTGGEPCRRKDTAITEELPSKCVGNQCLQQPNIPAETEMSTEYIPIKDVPIKEIPTQDIDSQITEHEGFVTTPVDQIVVELQHVTTEHSLFDKTETEKAPLDSDIATEELILAEVESTKKPDRSEQEVIGKPTEKETSTVSTKEDIENPTEEEGITYKPDDSEDIHGDEMEGITIVPGGLEEGYTTSYTETQKVDEPYGSIKPHTDKATTVEESTKTSDVSANTDKSILIEEEATRKADDKSEVTNKPDLQESTLMKEQFHKRPDLTTERKTEESTLSYDSSTIGTDILGLDGKKDSEVPVTQFVEKQTVKSTQFDEGVTKIYDTDDKKYTDETPSVEQATKMPSLIDEENLKPDLIPNDIKEHTDKAVIIDIGSTRVPDIQVHDRTDKPDSIVEVTKTPEIEVEKYTSIPSSIEDVLPETSDADSDIQMKEKPVLVEEELPEIPTAVKEEDKEKLHLNEKDSITQSINIEEDTEMPEVIEDGITKKPILIDETVESFTEYADDRLTIMPSITQEVTTNKIVLSDNKMKDKPLKTDEYTQKPDFMEKENAMALDKEPEIQTTNPVFTITEQNVYVTIVPEIEGSGVGETETHTTKFDIELPITSTEYEKESEERKETKRPIYSTQSYVSGDSQTESYLVPIEERITERTSESPDVKSPAPTDTETHSFDKHPESNSEIHQPLGDFTPFQDLLTVTYETTESIESAQTTNAVTKASELEIIGIDQEISTGLPEQSLSVTKSPEVVVPIEPQEGEHTDLPEKNLVGSIDEESTTKVMEEVTVKQDTPETIVTQTSPKYDTTSDLLATEIDRVAVTSPSSDEATHKIILPELEKGTVSTQSPIDTSEDTDTSSPVTVEKDIKEKPTVLVQDIGQEEHHTKLPELSDQTYFSTSTMTPELYISVGQTSTEIPQSHVTAATEVKPEEPRETDIPVSVTKPSDTYAQTPVEGDEHKLSTEFATATTEIETKSPHIHVSTEASSPLDADRQYSEKEKDQTQLLFPQTETASQEKITEVAIIKPVVTTSKPVDEITKISVITSTSEALSETTPYLIELEEHTHKVDDLSITSTLEEDHTDKLTVDIISPTPSQEDDLVKTKLETTLPSVATEESIVIIAETLTTRLPPTPGHEISEEALTVSPSIGTEKEQEPKDDYEGFKISTVKVPEEKLELATVSQQPDISSKPVDKTSTLSESLSYQTTLSSYEETTAPTGMQDQYEYHEKDLTTPKIPTLDIIESKPTISTEIVKSSDSEEKTEKESLSTEKSIHPDIQISSEKTTLPENELIFFTSEATPMKQEQIPSLIYDDKDQKPVKTGEIETLVPGDDQPEQTPSSEPVDMTPPVSEDKYSQPSEKPATEAVEIIPPKPTSETEEFITQIPEDKIKSTNEPEYIKPSITEEKYDKPEEQPISETKEPISSISEDKDDRYGETPTSETTESVTPLSGEKTGQPEEIPGSKPEDIIPTVSDDKNSKPIDKPISELEAMTPLISEKDQDEKHNETTDSGEIVIPVLEEKYEQPETKPSEEMESITPSLESGTIDKKPIIGTEDIPHITGSKDDKYGEKLPSETEETVTQIPEDKYDKPTSEHEDIIPTISEDKYSKPEYNEKPSESYGEIVTLIPEDKYSLPEEKPSDEPKDTMPPITEDTYTKPDEKPGNISPATEKISPTSEDKDGSYGEPTTETTATVSEDKTSQPEKELSREPEDIIPPVSEDTYSKPEVEPTTETKETIPPILTDEDFKYGESGEIVTPVPEEKPSRKPDDITPPVTEDKLSKPEKKPISETEEQTLFVSEDKDEKDSEKPATEIMTPDSQVQYGQPEMKPSGEVESIMTTVSADETNKPHEKPVTTTEDTKSPVSGDNYDMKPTSETGENLTPVPENKYSQPEEKPSSETQDIIPPIQEEKEITSTVSNKIDEKLGSDIDEMITPLPENIVPLFTEVEYSNPDEKPTSEAAETVPPVSHDKDSEYTEKPTSETVGIMTPVPEDKFDQSEKKPSEESEDVAPPLSQDELNEKPISGIEETASPIYVDKGDENGEKPTSETGGMVTPVSEDTYSQPERKPSNGPEDITPPVSEDKYSQPSEKPATETEDTIPSVVEDKDSKHGEKPTSETGEIMTPLLENIKPDEKPSTEIIPPSATSDIPKPIAETHPTDDITVPEDDTQFPPSGTGYGEPDYVEEDQAFGPGTCRYGGKVYVSAQQIPRDDPCDFCFCFRSDIICLQQSCPPPIHGCHEEPIRGFCCPRYECPVSMATTVNVTTTTTTTTTTLPPHFPTHSYKGAAQRRGCQIKGHSYKVGEVVRSSSGPCLHCTCGGDGQMKCDPKACTPEPMLRQMIAAAVSAKRRR